MKRLFGLVILLAAAALPCHAQELAFGGSAEDILWEAAAVDRGFLAVGQSASDDGTLSTRSRSGEAGWAVRVGADGRQQWYFCSGKSGMCEMIAPCVYADGRCALVLTDETRQRGEWIVLSASGKQESRAAIPALSALCTEGKAGRLIAMTPTFGADGPYLMLLLAHESGALCAAVLLADGTAVPCSHFYGDVNGVLRASPDGGAVYVSAELGVVLLTQLAPGSQMEQVTLPLTDGIGAARVTDAYIDGDGSQLLSVQTITADQKTASMLLRLNAEGEMLFAHAFEADNQLAMLTETDTGYAVYAGTAGSIIFFDEDGALQGSVRIEDKPLDLLPAGDGVYLLTHDAQRGRRQAVFTRIARPETALVSEAGDALEEEEMAEKTAMQSLLLAKGRLLCSDVIGGVSVARVDEDGVTLWQTRIPIHTAADRLVWESAQLHADGSILLSGYYETDMPEGLLREGASALLSADGVLKEIGLTEK